MREFMNITKALVDAKKPKESEAIRETVRPRHQPGPAADDPAWATERHIACAVSASLT